MPFSEDKMKKPGAKLWQCAPNTNRVEGTSGADGLGSLENRGVGRVEPRSRAVELLGLRPAHWAFVSSLIQSSWSQLTSPFWWYWESPISIFPPSHVQLNFAFVPEGPLM